MTPAFDIQGGLALAAARGFSVVTLMLAFGSILYTRVIAPKNLGMQSRRRVRRLSAWSLAVAFLGGFIWLMAQTDDFTNGLAPSDAWAVLAHTLFGHLLAARLVLLLVAAGLWAVKLEAGSLLSCATAMILQAGHSHGVAMGGPLWLIAASGLHVLAAGAWLGGLPALALVVAGEDERVARIASTRFSGSGSGCVGVLLLTSAAQCWILVMGLPGLFGTAYGWMVCAKILGFAALLALAARNRFGLTPALVGTKAGVAKTSLRRAIIIETAIGLLVVCAAGVLSELPPPMHIQALWPFGWLPSLEAAREDPDIAHEVLLYGLSLAAGAALLLAAPVLAYWRLRLVAGATALAGIGLTVLSAPHLSPLLVPAEPTIFFHSPSGFTTASIDSGKTVFAANCTGCHGIEGRGDGPAAKALSIPPANLTAGHLWMHPDGQLFWWLAHGVENPEGGLAMPGFTSVLSEDDRWDLIDYIRANNAGLSARPDGRWTMHLRAPDFSMNCGGHARNLVDLQGMPVLIVFGGAPSGKGVPGARMVAVGTMPPSDPHTCHTEDPGIAAAYAVVTGAASGAVLVDSHGWLRQFAPDAMALDADDAAKPMPAQAAMPMMNMKM